MGEIQADKWLAMEPCMQLIPGWETNGESISNTPHTFRLQSNEPYESKYIQIKMV